MTRGPTTPAESPPATPSFLGRLGGHPADSAALWHPRAAPVTYGQLGAHSAGIAAALLAGRRSLDGGRVALLLPPGRGFVAALLAIWRAGGVAVPLSALHTPPELTHILSAASPEATVVDAALASHLDQVVATQASSPAAGKPVFGRRFDLAELAVATDEANTGFLESPDRHVYLPLPEARAAALMLFTSGTTGKPKGVLLSHEGVAATLSALATAWRWEQGDRLLHALPLYHTHGLIVALLGALWVGASVQFTAFHAPDIWEAFAGVSVFMAVPTMYVRLMETFSAASPAERARWADGARRLRLFTSGSAALPASLWGEFAEATGKTILERYGMTEIGMALGNPYDGPRVPGSVGVPLPGVHVDIVGDDGNVVGAPGEPGELRVRSPQLFLGYHGDPAATASSYDSAGRFCTGDTAERDASGFVRLLGRTSVDILKSGGYKLSALEIEDALRAHPAVAEVAVIGVPDAVWGDCVTACVVPRPGLASPTLAELRAFLRDALAPYKLPRALRVLGVLPRNPMGKVQKSLLK